MRILNLIEHKKTIKKWNLHLSLVAAIFMWLCSAINMDLLFTPVPVTLQLAVCLGAGAVFGGGIGALAMIIYICLGVLGLPVFAGFNSGMACITGPTGGYIMGFVPCAFFSGKLTRLLYKPCGTVFIQAASIFVSFALSTLALYFFGSLHFSFVTGNGLLNAVALAVFPFIWLDFLKIIVSSLVTLRLFQVADINAYDKQKLYKI